MFIHLNGDKQCLSFLQELLPVTEPREASAAAAWTSESPRVPLLQVTALARWACGSGRAAALIKDRVLLEPLNCWSLGYGWSESFSGEREGSDMTRTPPPLPFDGGILDEPVAFLTGAAVLLEGTCRQHLKLPSGSPQADAVRHGAGGRLRDGAFQC